MFWGGATGRQGEGSIAADSPPCPFNAPGGPPGSLQEAPRGPPTKPRESTYHTMLLFTFLLCFSFFMLLHLFHFLLHFCYVFPYPSSRFGREAPRGGPREAPRGGPREAPRGGPPGEEAHMPRICAFSWGSWGLPGGLLQAPWGVLGGIERTGWGVWGSSCDTTLSLAPLRTPQKGENVKKYERLICAFHICINMCKHRCESN